MDDDELIREAHESIRRYSQTKREASTAYDRARASIRDLARGDYDIAIENGVTDRSPRSAQSLLAQQRQARSTDRRRADQGVHRRRGPGVLGLGAPGLGDRPMRLSKVLERAAVWLAVCEVDDPSSATLRMLRHVQADYIASVVEREDISIEAAAQLLATDYLYQQMEKQHDRVPQGAR